MTWDEVAFGFARCQRQYGQKDAAFDANLRRMHARGDAFVGGGYEFALPDTYLPDPVERARASWRFFTEGEPPRPVDLYALDLERSPVGQDETNAWARAWFDEWTRVADRRPGIYLGSGYLTNRTGQGLREHGFAWLWYPRPFTTTWDTTTWPDSYAPPLPKDRAGNPVAWEDCAWHGLPNFWQFAFGSPYDGDLFDGTLAQLRALNGG